MKRKTATTQCLAPGPILFFLAVFLLTSFFQAQAAEPMVATNYSHTVGLKEDGTVVAVGSNVNGQLNVGTWTGIAQVAAGADHTVGKKSDGTVVAVGNNNHGQLNVGTWTGIAQVAAGLAHTVGLKEDGTVVAVGYNFSGQTDVGTWTEIAQVAAGDYHTVGVKEDGTVVAVGFSAFGQLNVGTWTGIAQVAAGNYHTVGLKEDGTVVAVGLNNDGMLNVGTWTEIAQVAAGDYHTVGLKEDGTVVAVGDNSYSQLETHDWDLDQSGPTVFAVTVAKTGTGSGTVTSDPPGVNCGSTCSSDFSEGTVVTLTASADPGSSFAGWSGSGCSGTGACTVTMNADVTVTATFTLEDTLPGVTPDRGTVGSILTITGAGFGNKKGKVTIRGAALKLAKDGWTDGLITGVVHKVLPPGVPSDVVIFPKEPKGAAPITLPGAFTMMAPEIVSVLPPSGSSGDPIQITGNFFGTKKGKVYLEVPGGKPKSCKVTSWGMDSIAFAVPKTSKSFPAETYPLRVTNKIGTTYAPSNFTVD